MAKFYTMNGITSMTMVIKPQYMNIQNGYPVVIDGEKVKFEGGELVLDDKQDKDKIEYLRKNKYLGIHFFEDIVDNTKLPTEPKQKVKV
jgi:hypothetical protein